MNESEDHDEDDDDNIPLSVLPEREKKKLKISEPKWTRSHIKMNMKSTSGADGRFSTVQEQLSGLNPEQIFEKLFNEKVIVHQTDVYARAANDHAFHGTGEEINVFI